jgi:competence protein ComEA
VTLADVIRRDSGFGVTIMTQPRALDDVSICHVGQQIACWTVKPKEMLMKTLLLAIVVMLLTLVGPAVAADKDTKAAAKTPMAAQKAPAAAEKLDLNTATEKELSELPGIGEVRSKAIIKGRPYKGKDELVERKILTQSVYNKIKDQVIAKQAK